MLRWRRLRPPLVDWKQGRWAVRARQHPSVRSGFCHEIPLHERWDFRPLQHREEKQAGLLKRGLRGGTSYQDGVFRVRIETGLSQSHREKFPSQLIIFIVRVWVLLGCAEEIMLAKQVTGSKLAPFSIPERIAVWRSGD